MEPLMSAVVEKGVAPHRGLSGGGEFRELRVRGTGSQGTESSWGGEFRGKECCRWDGGLNSPGAGVPPSTGSVRWRNRGVGAHIGR